MTLASVEARRALVVEDEPLIRMGAVDLCETAGFVVDEAGDADEAMKMLLSGASYDLLHTDIDMPGSMDGVSLAWRAGEIWPNIAIIVVSGKMMVPHGTLPRDARFFTKPGQESQLAQAISDLVVLT
jgi:CheY-like chemotaxis protein